MNNIFKLGIYRHTTALAGYMKQESLHFSGEKFNFTESKC